jgi:hypothetical protein
MADSHGIPRAPCYSGPPQRETLRFHLPDSHRLRSAIPNHSATQTLYHSPPARQNQHKTIPQPRERNTCRLSHAHGLACSPFAHHYSGNHKMFSSPAGTKMFHFPASPPTALYIQTAATPHNECQVTPFGNPRITAWLPAPRGISQTPTSFIGP